MKTMRSTLGLAMVMALSAACASAPAAEDDDAFDETTTEVVVQTENNQVPPTAVTVTMLGPGAAESLLGTVPPGNTEDFVYDPADFPGETFRLRATGTAGEEILSEPFTLARATAVRWDLADNDVNVVRTQLQQLER